MLRCTGTRSFVLLTLDLDVPQFTKIKIPLALQPSTNSARRLSHTEEGYGAASRACSCQSLQNI